MSSDTPSKLCAAVMRWKMRSAELVKLFLDQSRVRSCSGCMRSSVRKGDLLGRP